MLQNRDFWHKNAILVPKMAVLVIFGPSAPPEPNKIFSHFWPILEPIPKNGQALFSKKKKLKDS